MRKKIYMDAKYVGANSLDPYYYPKNETRTICVRYYLFSRRITVWRVQGWRNCEIPGTRLEYPNIQAFATDFERVKVHAV